MDSDAAMAEAGKFEQAKDFDAAADVLVKHLLKNGADPVAASKLSDILIQKGDFQKALQISAAVMRINPDYDWPYVLQFRSALELKKFSLARKILSKLGTLETNANLDRMRGDYFRLTGNLMKADDYYKKSIRQDPKSKELRELRIWNLKNSIAKSTEQKDTKSAAVGVSRLLKITKGGSRLDALEISADLRIKERRFELAEKELTEIHSKSDKKSINTKLADVRITLASQSYSSGNIEQTEKWLNLADSLGPNYQSFILRANIRRDEGKYENAAELYTKAEALNDQDAALFEAMAWNYTLWSRLQDAEEAISKAIELKPEDPRYRVIRANQFKNSRKLSMALAELIKGRKLCESQQNCSRFDEIYDERYFENTDAEGLSLDAIGIPVTMTAAIGYREDATDLLSISRGLAAQNIGEKNYSLFLSPSKSPVVHGRIQFGYYKADKPFISSYYERLEKIGKRREKDPSIALVNQIAGIETEGSYPLPFFGVISIFPYLKVVNNDAHAFDTRDISGGMVVSSEYLIGTRALWLFRWYLPALEGEVSAGKLIENSKNKFNTIRARAGLQQNFTRYVRFQLEGGIYSKRRSSVRVQTESNGQARLNVFLNSGTRLTGGYRLVATDDASVISSEGGSSRARTLYRETILGLALSIGEYFRAESTFTKSLVEPYRVYDFVTMNNEFEISMRPRLRREIGLKNKLPYVAPVRLTFGQNVQIFKAPTSRPVNRQFLEQTRLASYFISTRFFW